MGRGAGGSSGVAPLDMALEVAEELGLPVMAHIDHPPPSRKEVLERLRPGDVLTHCYRPFPNSLLRARRRRARGSAARPRARRDLRHRTRRRLVRLPRVPRPAGRRLSSRRHFERRARPQRRRPGVRSAHDDVQVPRARRRRERAGRGRHRRAGDARSAGRRSARSRSAAKATRPSSTSSTALSSFTTRRVSALRRTGASGSKEWWLPENGGHRRGGKEPPRK